MLKESKLNSLDLPPLTFSSVHFPNGQCVIDISVDVRTLLNFDVNTFLLGDFKVHSPLWNCTRPSEYGNAIHNIFFNSNADIIFPDSPTHHTSASSNTIDFGIFIGFNFYKKYAFYSGIEF